jgi:hypothetical protein
MRVTLTKAGAVVNFIEVASLEVAAALYPDLTARAYQPGDTIPLTAAQQAEFVANQKDVADASTANAYAKLAALKAMTPAQVQAWVTANVTTLAQAQDAIATLAIAVSVLSRRI